MSSEASKVRSRGDDFAPKLETKITLEKPPAHNPYQTEQQFIHGYDHMELLEKLSFSDTIYLLLRGNLPSTEDKTLFNKLCIAFINPGVRNAAGQAAIIAGVGKTDPLHMLPIAMGVYGGRFEGAGEIETMLREFRRFSRKPAQNAEAKALSGDITGMSTVYGDPDVYADKLLQYFAAQAETGKTIKWLYELQKLVLPKGIGATKAAVAAGVMADLGFQPRQGGPLLQMLSAPGLLAHGMEYSNKPLTAMKFESDEDYLVEPKDE